MTLIRIMISLAFLFGNAALVSAGECETPSETVAYFRQVMPGSKIIYIQGPRATRFLKAFNVVPPKSTFAGDAIAIVKPMRDRRRVYLVIYSSGCLKHRGTIPSRLADQLLGLFDKGGRDA